MYSAANVSIANRKAGRLTSVAPSLSLINTTTSNTRIAVSTADVHGGLTYRLSNVVNIRKPERIAAETPHHVAIDGEANRGVGTTSCCLRSVSHKSRILKIAYTMRIL